MKADLIYEALLWLESKEETEVTKEKHERRRGASEVKTLDLRDTYWMGDLGGVKGTVSG